MEPVLKRCEDVISNQAGSLSPNHLFQLTRTLSQHQRNSLSMSILLDKLVRMDNQLFNTLPFDNIRGGLVADIFTVKARLERESNNKRSKNYNNKSNWKNYCCFSAANSE